MASPFQAFVYAQAASTDTPTLGGPGAYITQTYDTPINVRTGPSTVYYPDPCAQMPVGTTAPAIGVSPNRIWIEIQFAACPGGVGWVYAANVTLSAGNVPIVEPPPTSTPLATATIDPTFAAQFSIVPTLTRLPTFTAPAPLNVPTFSVSEPSVPAGFPMGGIIFVVIVIGAVVFVVSIFVRR